METFLEYETICREPPPGHVFVGRLAEIDPRKVAEVVRGSCDKQEAQLLLGWPTVLPYSRRLFKSCGAFVQIGPAVFS